MVQRFSVSLDEALLADFDALIDSRGYTNRSEALRDLIRDDLVRRQWEEDGQVIGVITFVYDHHQPNLQARVTAIQHDCHERVISATHVHVNHHDCLEVIIVSGRAAAVRDLQTQLASLRGVKNCSLSITAAGEENHHAHE